MTVIVYNRSKEDIVLRYAPNGHHSLPVNQSIQLSLPIGTELFACRNREQNNPYARLKITDSSRELHFTDVGGSSGRGTAVVPQQQPQQQQQSGLQFVTPAAFAARSAPALPGSTLQAASAGFGAPVNPAGAEVPPTIGTASPGMSTRSGRPTAQTNPDDMVEVPGLGLVRKDSVNPEVLARLQQEQQQQLQQQEPEMPTGRNGRRRLAYVQPDRTWVLPLLILVVLILFIGWKAGLLR